jgi:large subunit ribosomal protein L33
MLRHCPYTPRERIRPDGVWVFLRDIPMAKKGKREDVWLECSECGERNYRTNVNVTAGTPKIELKKFCNRDRKRTVHKIRRK